MQIRIRLVVAWTIAMLLALTFVTGGVPKLNPNAQTLERFANWGYSGSFARVIGILETAGGVLVLIPTLAAYGAGILCVGMAGAIYTHLSTGIGDPGAATTLLVMAGVLLALRAPHARRFGTRS